MKYVKKKIDRKTQKLLDELRQQTEQEPTEYYFSNPDPYMERQPPEHHSDNIWFDEDGNLCIKNPSASWLPEFTLQKEIGGTVYTVTGSYDGDETLNQKMKRVLPELYSHRWEDSNDK